jgi:hypothetical protein
MRTLCIAAAAALVLGAAPASAAVRFNLTGVVTSGSDNGYVYEGQGAPFGSESFSFNLNTGETFGSPVGRSFNLLITLDESRGTEEVYPNLISRYGSNADSPAKAAFTLNGYTYELGAFTDTTASGGVEKYNRSAANGGDAFGAYFESQRLRPPMIGAFTNQTGVLSLGFLLPASTFNTLDFAEPAQWTRTSNERQNGRLQLTLQNTDGLADRYVILPSRSADLVLRFDSLTVTSDPDLLPTAVPEPTTWAMMILGFGLAGAGLRRRRLTVRGLI